MTIQKIDSSEHLALYVTHHIQKLASRKHGLIHIGISGGRSAAYIIEGLVSLPLELLSRLELYLVDERLEAERNVDTLLEAGLQEAFSNNSIRKRQLHIPAVGEPLSHTMFDAVYVSAGEDGHFASLFPGSFANQSKEQTILVEDSPKMPKKRVSLSFEGFTKLAAKAEIILLFFGEGKRQALSRLLANEDNPNTLPCSFLTTGQFDTTIITDLEELV